MTTTAKWVITAFAAVGAVMFAKGFVTTPKLSWDTHAGQLLAAWACGVVGVAGVGWLIFLVSKLLVPEVYTLGSLPEPFLTQVDAKPRDYLPSQCESVDDLRAQLKTYRIGVVNAEQKVTTRQRDLKTAETRDQVVSSDVTAASNALAQAQDTADLLRENLRVLLQGRQQLLDQAGFWSRATAYSLNLRLLCAAALLAAVGGIGYQLVLSAPDKEEPKPAANPAAGPAFPAVGQMVQSDTPAGRRLWSQLDLTRCQLGRAAVVPVIVTAGAGTATDPYHVSTVATTGCTPQSFTVVNDVALVSLPAAAPAITYTPAPSASPSPATHFTLGGP